MTALYRLSESQAAAAALVGVGLDTDIERRQHVHQLSHKVLAGCRQASQPFTWIRAAGLNSIAAALSVGLENGQALTAVLEATYSQVLEVILSALDRDLIPTNPAAAGLAAACQHNSTHNNRSSSSNGGAGAGDAGGSRSGGGGDSSSSSSARSSVQPSELLSAVGRYPAGYAPAAASSEELQEAFRVLQALCLLHPKARSLLCKAQYLQLVTARACEAPACLPAAMNTLLTLLQGNEEAQGLFVTTGGLDMLITRTLQHLRQQDQPQSPTASAAGSSSGGGGLTGGGGGSSSGNDLIEGGPLTRRELAVQLLMFLQLLEHWVISAAVQAGAHPSTQRTALALLVNHLGPDVAAAVSQELPDAAAEAAEPTAATSSSQEGQQQHHQSPESVLQKRAEAAADKLLRRLQAAAPGST